MAIKGREIIAYLAVKYNQNWDDIYNAIKTKEPINVTVDKTQEQVIEETLATLKGEFVTIIDDNYPEELKHISHPPFVLFLNIKDQDRFNDDVSRKYCALLEPRAETHLSYDEIIKQVIALNEVTKFEAALALLEAIGFERDEAANEAFNMLNRYLAVQPPKEESLS